jgi:hypothetical protein
MSRPDAAPERGVTTMPYAFSPILLESSKKRKAVPLIINGPLEHVHLLVSLPASESLAE